jgi:hypothetical protein
VEAHVQDELVPRVIDGLLLVAIVAAKALVALWGLPLVLA